MVTEIIELLCVCVCVYSCACTLNMFEDTKLIIKALITLWNSVY